MTPDEALASLSDEQLDALLTDPGIRGPGKRRLEEEKTRRTEAAQ